MLVSCVAYSTTPEEEGSMFLQNVGIYGVISPKIELFLKMY
jgi:hypothetical protein